MKVVVGSNTIVKKVTVGTPLRIGSAANGTLTGLDDVNGSVNLSDGTILQYDSDTGLFKHVSPTTITGSGLDVSDAGGLGSISYDSSNAILTYTGPSSDSIHSLFNATYDSNSLGTLSYTDGTVRLVGPTDAQIRALFSAGNSLNYNEATGEFSVTVPETGASFDSDFGTKTTDDLTEGSTNLYYTDSRGRAAISVIDNGGFGSLSYNNVSGEITFDGSSVSEVRSVINVGDNLAYDSATGKITFTGTLSGDYTDSDARHALSVINTGNIGSLSYNSSTGQITYQGATDSDIRGKISASGDIAYDQNTGIISFTERTDAQIRALFNVSGDLGYDTSTGVFSVDLGSVDVTDSAITRALFSVVNDSGDYGSLSYDNTTGQFTFNKVTDSDIRNSISVSNNGGGYGFITYNPTTGTIDHTGVQPAQIRGLFSGAGDIVYDANSGQFSLTVGAHYTDSDARNAFSVNFVGDTAFDSSPYGGASYDTSTGVLTINGTTDSNIRSSLTVEDSGGLGSLNYFVKQGRIVYKGPETADIAGTLSANLDSLSMGQFTLDSNTGQFTFKLEDDSVRSLFSVVSDDEGGTSFSYDPATGVFTYSGPSVLDLRSQLNAGLGLDYHESSGTFRLDSSANIITGSIVTGALTVNDSAYFSNGLTLLNNSTLKTNVITAGDSFQNLNITGTIKLSGERVLIDTPFFHSTDNRIVFSVDDSNIDNLDGGGFILGGGSNIKLMLYNKLNDKFELSTGLDVAGELSGPTIDSINKRIDELPDSAQMKGILSAGPGLSYDNVNGIYRIASSGVVAGTYGTPTQVPQIAVDSLGQIDSVGLVPISVTQDLNFDSITGQITITTATDSFNAKVTLDPFTTNNLVEGDNLYYTRARFDSALGDNASRTQIRTYIDSAAGTEPFKDTVRGYFSVNDLGGQGALTYDSDTGQITYTGAVIRKAGRGLNLDSDTGTFRIDSTSDVWFNSIRVDSAYVNRLNVDSAIKIAENGYIEFTPTDYLAVPDRLEGRMWYDQDAKTIAFYGAGDSHIHYVNERIHVRVRNSSGSTIPKGAPVHITGVHISGHPIHGHHPTVELADASDINKKDVIGIAGENIVNGAHGYIIKSGYVDGINTSHLTEGQRVHLGFSAPGTITALAPEYPNYPMDIGTCLTSDSFNGTILVEIFDHTFERIRITQSGYIDGNLTVAGNLNIQGSQTTVGVANLSVADNFIYLAGGDTVSALIKDSADLNDLSFRGHYEGDSDLTYYVRISAIDGAHDDIQWSFDSTFATLEPFDSAGGPTTYHLNDTLPVALKYGVSVDFEAITGHKIGDAWQGAAAPTNVQLGVLGNYNTPTEPYAHTGVFRDNADGRWKFFDGYRPEIEGFVDVADSTYTNADLQFGTAYGNLIGNVTGNVTGQVSDLSNHTTANLPEDPLATDSSGTQYFTSARVRSSLSVVDAGGDGSFTYDSATGQMVYTGPSEADFYQHFKDNADSLGDLTFDSAYGTNGGFKLHERHITRHEEVFADSFVTTQEYFLIYSGTTGGVLKKVRADTLASTIGGGGGGAGGGLFGYINM